MKDENLIDLDTAAEWLSAIGQGLEFQHEPDADIPHRIAMTLKAQAQTILHYRQALNEVNAVATLIRETLNSCVELSEEDIRWIQGK